ncbi:hypothetical protein BDN70DRAFT_873027 [Pholiota conissans]|uniref:Uncharacterized protein n=1 Tax=Pholiota conissans TaxID=109636 RepID=A0A9P6CXH9_9AGAR|nr:hypothetical protein BDN70DRAFT_873027 [Pholiota conissans]
MRNFLTAEYTTFVWKRAYVTNLLPISHIFGNAEYPPECPPGVDIRHYTSVLFGETCMCCAAPKAHIVHCSALTRLCKSCAKVHLVPLYHVPYNEIMSLCRQCPSYNSNDRYDSYSSNCIFREEFETRKSAMRRLRGKARTNYSAAELAKRKQESITISQLLAWGIGLKNEKRPLDYHRVKWGRDRLDAEGYPHERYAEIAKHFFVAGRKSGIRGSFPFNDDGWDMIKDKVLPALESERQRRRRSYILNTFRGRIEYVYDLLEETLKAERKPWIHPSLSTVATSEPFSSTIRDNVRIADEDGDNEEDEEEDEDSTAKEALSGLADFVPGVLIKWRDEADQYLLNLLLEAPESAIDLAGGQMDRTPLELATTFFKCQFCAELISYPRILVHGCLKKRRHISSVDDIDVDVEPRVHGVPTVTEESTWHTISSWSGPTWIEAKQFISAHEAAANSARTILQDCAEDPDVVTFESMKDRDLLLECMCCASPEAGAPRHIMNWDMAILHDISVHHDDSDKIYSQRWSPVTSSSDRALVEARLNAKRSRKPPTKSYERCRHCDATVRVTTAANHLRRKHDIVSPASLQDHVYVLLDAPMKAYSVKI